MFRVSVWRWHSSRVRAQKVVQKVLRSVRGPAPESASQVVCARTREGIQNVLPYV